MLFKPAIDGTIASTVLVPSGRHYSQYLSVKLKVVIY